MIKNNRIREFPERVKLAREFEGARLRHELALQAIAEDVAAVIKESGLNASIKHRVKEFDSYFNKLIRRLRDPECDTPYDITDILGIRIICPFLEDIAKAEALLRERFDIAESEHKGKQRSFREFGYESVHLMIRCSSYYPAGTAPKDAACETQLSTTLQDAWSEVEHELVYKAGLIPFDMPLKRKLAALNANLTLADIIFQEIRDYHRSIHRQMRTRRDNIFDLMAVHDEVGPVPPEGNGTMDEKTAALETMPEDSIDNILLKAITAHNDGQYEMAVRLYTHLLEMGDLPEHTRSVLHNHRGIAHMAEAKYDSADADFTEAIKAQGSNYRAYTNRGICRRIMGDHPAAMMDLDASLEINPYSADSYYSKSLVLYDLGDLALALENCQKALNFRPDSASIGNFISYIKKRMFYDE